MTFHSLKMLKRGEAIVLKAHKHPEGRYLAAVLRHFLIVCGYNVIDRPFEFLISRIMFITPLSRLIKPEIVFLEDCN